MVASFPNKSGRSRSTVMIGRSLSETERTCMTSASERSPADLREHDVLSRYPPLSGPVPRHKLLRRELPDHPERTGRQRIRTCLGR